MEERPSETNANVDSSAPPSVARLAVQFQEQVAAAKETPASKPARRKPPCSLPLFPPKVELGQNGEEKSSPNASHPPKIKVKSSPLIEKLQANLTFDPAALLPGASPKSPGLKAMVSPFHSPPSTPSSPGIWSQPGEAEEAPVSFDQPPEGSHLTCYNKVRTRGSIKRRPPSRRFRRSQSDCGDLGDFRAAEPSQENGSREENRGNMFPTKSKASGSQPPSKEAAAEGAQGNQGPTEKLPLSRTSSRTERQEKTSAPQEVKHGESPTQEAVLEAPQTSSPQAKNGCASPVEEAAAGEATETKKSTEVVVGNEGDRPGQKSPEAKKPEEEGTRGAETSQCLPGGMKSSNLPEKQKGKEKQEEGAGLEPGCSPGAGCSLLETSSEIHSGEAVPMDEPPCGGN